MNAEQLLQHFERISEAPDAIPRLRRFILDLAVRGKLVEQDPRDEPAAELLKRIATEKARLVKAGKARKLEVDPVTNEEISFPVPSNWVWTRLGSIGDWGSGSTPSRGNSELYGGGITWLKSGELNDNRALEGSEETVSKLAVEKGSFRINKTGDVLIAMYGATIGKVAILAESAVTNQAICGCTPFPGVFNQYLFFYLLSQRAQFHSASEGGAQPNISKVKIIWTTFPLPPLTEQHRIVAKVDELMNLCDQLDAAKAEGEKCRDSLVAASLQRLNQPVEEEETFREHARFTFTNLPRISTRAAHIKQLRQTILGLAFRGKLVEQDPSDEPVEELLKRIAAEKAKMVKAGDIKTKKICEPSMAEATYLLPSTWKWVALESVFDYDAGIKTEPKKLDQNLWLLELEDVEKDTGRLVERVRASERTSQSTKSEFKINDILYGKLRPYLNKVLLADEQGYSTTEIVAIRPYIPLCSKYCVLALRRPDFLDYVTRLGQGTKMPRLRTEDAKVAPFPLPPLAEQQRIVAKVDELMAICDQLEAQITATEQDSRRFLESVLADALAPGIDLREVAEVA